MHRFDLTTIAPSPWKNGGGHTRELACWPPGSGVGDFDWRISVATIASSGPFSTFPGVDRQTMLLGGDGVRLRSSDGGLDQTLDQRGQSLRFAGEAPLDCTLLAGPSTDLNLMLRRERWQGAMALVCEARTPGRSPAGLCMVLAGRWCADEETLTFGQGFWWSASSAGPALVPQVGLDGAAPLLAWVELTPVDPFSTAPSADGVWENLYLVPGLARPDLPVPEGAAASLVVQGGVVRWTGPSTALPDRYARLPRHDAQGTLATPGLVDCHTHLVYGGQRAHEFAMRLAGASYEEIAQAGGGIVSSVRATREASEEALYASAVPRLQALLDEGVCAIEIKSGYGLCLEHERKQLRVARRLGATWGVTVRTTFLGAHALPPEYAGRSQAYIDLVCQEMLPALAAEGLVDAVDVFCERIAFSLDETEQVFQAAQRLGIPVKLHAEQLSDMGGAPLAARYGALSCDHIEHLSQDGIEAMQASGTVAVLLPGAFYTLRDTQLPPIAALRAAGVPMAVSTDHNPGTSPALSLRLMANMACTLFRLTVPEALAGITTQAARALGLSQTHGLIASGRPAHFVLWTVREAAELVYWFGHNPVHTIVRQGRIVKEPSR